GVDGEPRDDELRNVGQMYGDDVAAPDADLTERRSHSAGPLAQLSVVDCTRGCRQRYAVIMSFDIPPEPIGQRLVAPPPVAAKIIGIESSPAFACHCSLLLFERGAHHTDECLQLSVVDPINLRL